MDWDKCLIELNNNSDFLLEFVGDLIEEAGCCRREVMHDLINKNFTKIEREVHKVRGSALYLKCTPLVICCTEIKVAAKLKQSEKISQCLREYDDALDKLILLWIDKKEELFGKF
jgi:HPt (histidine-containing phosphotransfer) domain-containing protein